MTPSKDEPQHLGDLLRVMAKRVKKVDLTVIEQIRQHWPRLLEPTLASECHPEFVKDGVLVISVPSGAYAQQIAVERDAILRGLTVLGDRAPTSLKTVRKA